MLKRIFLWLNIWLVIAPAGLVAESRQISRHSVLQMDFQSGRLSRAEYVAYQLLALMNHADLPLIYQEHPREMSRMGTAFMMEARSLVETSQGREKELLEKVLYRPDNLPLIHISPSGLFKMHYTDAGANAAADTFIMQSALAYDQVYDIIIEQLGFDPPPIDDPAEPEYDVYIYSVGGYGLSTPENPAPSEKYPHGYTSYISMDNEFTITYTKGVDGMLVTAAHEFFHMVQMGMRSFSTSEFDSRWLFEGTATWMEDYAYDEINDYVQYLPYYMGNLKNSFHTFDGLHEYGSCIFYHMLEKKYGAEIIKTMWSEFAQRDVWEALDGALKQRGSSFKSEFADHMIWNYFTGVRAHPERYYAEGGMYPLVQPDQTHSIDESLGFSDRTACLSAHYIKIAPTTFGNLLITPSLNSPTHWLYSVIALPVNLEARTSTSAGNATVLLSDVSASEDICVIPTNVFLPANGDTYVEEDYTYDLSLGQVTGISAGIRHIHPNPFQPAVHGSGVCIAVRLTEKTKRINYHIINENGRVIYSNSVQFDSELNGDFSLFWDGAAQDGTVVSSGIYLFYLDANQEIKPGKIAVIN
ncbi:hypothetical protein JW998_14880 [candidate division KSB1 bacterium]|nr:hypothetical protein [candidate division KSB1 bacterium]